MKPCTLIIRGFSSGKVLHTIKCESIKRAKELVREKFYNLYAEYAIVRGDEKPKYKLL